MYEISIKFETKKDLDDFWEASENVWDKTNATIKALNEETNQWMADNFDKWEKDDNKKIDLIYSKNEE